MKMSKLAAVVIAVLAVAACNDRRDNETGDVASGASGQAATPPAGATDATAANGTSVPPESGAMPEGALASGTDPSAMGPGAGTPADAMGKDADLLGVLAAINQHEIDAATQAKQHKLPADVGKYADMMLTDHRANLEQTRALGANEQAPSAMTQAEQGKQHLQELGKKPDAQYAKAYVDAMVMGHTQALAALDEQLIPAAQSASVKTHLQQTRAKVAEHLEQAKALQAGK